METHPQLYGRLFASHFFEQARLAPYGGVGLMQPASYVDADGDAMIQVTEHDVYQVPDGQDPVNILGALAGVQVDVSKSVVVVGELLYRANSNMSDSTEDAETGEVTNVPVAWNEINALGFNLMARARF
jgi:hypothetical protein